MKYVVKVPRNREVLLLEDSEERINWFQKRIRKLSVVRTSQEMIKKLENGVEQYGLIFLDHDLGGIVIYKDRVEITQGKEDTGLAVAEFLAARGFIGTPVLIHSWNPAGVTKMLAALRHANALAFGQFEIELVDDESVEK